MTNEATSPSDADQDPSAADAGSAVPSPDGAAPPEPGLAPNNPAASSPDAHDSIGNAGAEPNASDYDLGPTVATIDNIEAALRCLDSGDVLCPVCATAVEAGRLDSPDALAQCELRDGASSA